MSGSHTEAVLNKLTKPELVQLLLKTEATLGSQITDLSKEIKDTLTHFKKLDADIAAVRTVNDRLVEGVVKTERQCLEKARYSRRDTLEIVGRRDVQACHHLKEKERTTVKFFNKNGCLQILRVKKELKSLDSTDLDYPENTKIFINESLCTYYRAILNKCKKLRAIQKIHQFYTINGFIRVKSEESGRSKVISHMANLKELFVDLGNL